MRIDGCLLHNSDEWETPKSLFDSLDHEFHFNVDLCANDKNHLCSRYYSNLDGAPLLVGQSIYCNPPYSKLSLFIEICSYLSYKNTVVMLIPARTDTIAFHEFIYKQENVEIRFIKGRIRFCKDGVPQSSAPFPSMIVVFKNRLW